MQIKSITVTYRRTFNLGNYESMQLEMSATADLEAADHEDEDGKPGEEIAEEDLWKFVKSSVREQALPVLKARRDEVQAIKDSLPDGTIGA